MADRPRPLRRIEVPGTGDPAGPRPGPPPGPPPPAPSSTPSTSSRSTSSRSTSSRSTSSPSRGAAAGRPPGGPVVVRPGAVGPVLPVPPGGWVRDGGVLIGVVEGQVTTDVEYRRPWGLRALGLAALAATVVALVDDLRAGVPVVRALLLTLAAPLFLLVVLGLIHRLILGGSGRHLRDTRRAAATTVRRFRVRELTGEVTACRLAGDLDGGEPRPGDLVEVQGRRPRRGPYRVRRVSLLAAPGGPEISTVTTRTTGPRLARRADLLAKVSASGLVWWTVVTMLGWSR